MMSESIPCQVVLYQNGRQHQIDTYMIPVNDKAQRQAVEPFQENACCREMNGASFVLTLERPDSDSIVSVLLFCDGVLVDTECDCTRERLMELVHESEATIF